MPLTWQRTFTVAGGSAGQLKNPLWYAAKWGGFDDQNGNNVPDLPSEWDKDGDGNPDTYFFVVNPLKMEEQLEKAFADILRRASSGATVATLTSRTGISSLHSPALLLSQICKARWHRSLLAWLS
jgi:type IV pilus assembly protein PilY1